jgi:hypothetical protein
MVDLELLQSNLPCEANEQVPASLYKCCRQAIRKDHLHPFNPPKYLSK